MTVNFPSNTQNEAALNITNKFKEASDQNIGDVVIIPSSFKEKIKQKFADSVIKPDITYKDLSALTGKTYRWNRSNSKISFDEMTNIINDPKVFGKFTDEQKITLIISYNNIKNKLNEGSTGTSDKIKKLFREKNIYKSEGDKAQEVVSRVIKNEVPSLIKQLEEKKAASEAERDKILGTVNDQPSAPIPEKDFTMTNQEVRGKFERYKKLCIEIREMGVNIKSLKSIK